VLNKLQSISVYNNEITELPSTLNTLPLLRSLTASVNNIKEMPRGFGSCPVLAYVDLSCNDIDTLPANFFFLTSLKALHLSDNRISIIPADISKLVNLETVNLIFYFYLFIFPLFLQLVMRDNKLASVGIPHQLSQCTKLRELNLQGNDIEYLPASLGSLHFTGERAYLKLSGNPLMTDLVEKLTKGVQVAMDYLLTDAYKKAVDAHIRKKK